jgi:hypothetical protein
VHYLGAPVAIRIQKENESIEETIRQLLTVSASKGCVLKILVRTKATDCQARTIHNSEIIDENLLIIDSHELMIQQWLVGKQKQADIL